MRRRLRRLVLQGRASGAFARSAGHCPRPAAPSRCVGPAGRRGGSLPHRLQEIVWKLPVPTSSGPMVLSCVQGTSPAGRAALPRGSGDHGCRTAPRKLVRGTPPAQTGHHIQGRRAVRTRQARARPGPRRGHGCQLAQADQGAARVTAPPGRQERGKGGGFGNRPPPVVRTGLGVPSSPPTLPAPGQRHAGPRASRLLPEAITPTPTPRCHATSRRPHRTAPHRATSDHSPAPAAVSSRPLF